jgi:hypothetical protein
MKPCSLLLLLAVVIQPLEIDVARSATNVAISIERIPTVGYCKKCGVGP